MAGILVSKNSKSFTFFKELQDKGEFVKEYSAICCPADSCGNFFDGFPEYNQGIFLEHPFIIESYFRPFGPGRKVVRPVIEDGKKHKEIARDKGDFYRTEIININSNFLTVRIKRGFRHQIRCHLCWIGYPIINDPLYFYGTANENTATVQGQLALRSHALFFADPTSGEKRECRITSL